MKKISLAIVMGLLLGVAAIMVHAAVSPIAGFYKEMTI